MLRDEILEMLDQPIESAAVGAALELGLPWLLDRSPLTATQIAGELAIPYGRCRAWLRVLETCGLVAATPEGYGPTGAARASILATYSRETWTLLAQEARERASRIADLPERLSTRNAPTGESIDQYVAVMSRDPDRARRFTRMLYELHQPLAAEVADALDLSGVDRLLDLGGGSGVLAERLVDRWPRLSITVVDVATVCEAGRELLESKTAGERVSFHAADFLADDLPGGWDVVLECDVGIYTSRLFSRIRSLLVPGGRFVVVDQLPAEVAGASSRWTLLRTLADPAWTAPTTASVRALLTEAGFGRIVERPLEPAPGVGGSEAGPLLIEATSE